MPNPAFEKLKQTAAGVVRVGGKAARTAAPVVRKAGADVTARLRRPTPHAPASPARPAVAPETPTPAAPPLRSSSPNPASIAKNVSHQRPVAKPPRSKRPTASDSPGGKLPPRR